MAYRTPGKRHPASRWQVIAVKVRETLGEHYEWLHLETVQNIHCVSVVKNHNQAFSLTRRHRKLNSKLSNHSGRTILDDMKKGFFSTY